MAAKKLSPVSAEYVRGTLIRIATKKGEAFNRYFPNASSEGGYIGYELVDDLTHDQAEYLIYEMEEAVSTFWFNENKVKSGYRGHGRPGLAPEDEGAIQAAIKDLQRKRKGMERAIGELRELYDLAN
ncbi:MAG TPA: hypothetical protein VMV28_05170 [Thermoplasmata archaeon]|nr:hypothetical protein [Thermoplasmata archaeon]